MEDWVYDIETYPNCFTVAVMNMAATKGWIFEISDRRDDSNKLRKFLTKRWKNKDRMIGFNNIGFDYPVMHYFMKHKFVTYGDLYDYAMEVIKAGDEEKFKYIIQPSNRFITQLDLYKIHHFDNKARATSLKMIEFNMRASSIEDLPFPVGKHLTDKEKDVLKKYNGHDVKMTRDFAIESKKYIDLREELSKKYDHDFMNHNDTKIGKDYFIMKLEEEIPGSCYKIVKGKRVLNQTKRDSINLGDVLFDYVEFKRPELQAVHEWFKKRIITETKGVMSDLKEHELGPLAEYAEMTKKRKKIKCGDGGPTETQKQKMIKDNPSVFFESTLLKSGKTSWHQCWWEASTLNCVVDGFRFDFGTGGIHGSIESSIVESDDEWVIIDVDVASMYPNIAIANRVYPAHLGEGFCDIYEDVYQQRKALKKAGMEAEQQMMKLALNGVYGDSNNQYSPFYDPMYTMKITINGQLSLCMLSEMALDIEGLQIIQVNTDGVTVRIKRKDLDEYRKIYHEWEKITGLELEEAVYDKMIIRDVNNYIAVYEGGEKLKRKGAYEYDGLGWHQNQSALVIPKAAEYALVYGGDIGEFIRNHKDKFDFMLRTKVPRSSRLVTIDSAGVQKEQQNICRYYISDSDDKLVKIMPPLLKNTERFWKKGDEHLVTRTETEHKKALKFEFEEVNITFSEAVKIPEFLLELERHIGIDKEWNVKICNKMVDFDWDIDYDYYIECAEKLVKSITEEE